MTPFILLLLRIVFVLVLLELTKKYLFSNCYSRSILFVILPMYDLDIIQQIQMISKKLTNLDEIIFTTSKDEMILSQRERDSLL
jgi:hypothetical protein